MTDERLPWYVRLVVGVGAWITAVVLMFLGGAIVFVALEFETGGALALIGAAYLWAGLRIIRQPDRGIFANQLGIATAAAGAALVCGGMAAEAEEVWVGVPIAVAIAAAIFMVSTNRILQFLASALAAGFFVATLVVERTPYALDIVALATPVGLYLLLRPPERDITPAAIVLLLLFPLYSTFIVPDAYWVRDIQMGGWLARAIHMALFLWLVSLHWKQNANHGLNQGAIAFIVAALFVCVLLPPGGSAALLIMTFAYVTGSTPFATLGVVLQAQYFIRYYYSLEMSLLNKSFLLMAVGVILLVSWWLAERARRQGAIHE